MKMFIQPFSILIPFVLGWLIDKKHPGHTIALLFFVMAYSSIFALIAVVIGRSNEVYPLPYASWINAITLTIGHILWLPGILFPMFLMPLYFPTGKLLSHRWRLPVFVVL